jgi:hypothetical protein
MKKSKEDVKLTSDQKLYKLATELYYRTKGKAYVNGSQAMLGEYDEQGNRRTLAQVLKVSKAYGITTFIELGYMETEEGKKYTSSVNVRWIGEAPTKEISTKLSQWCKDYSKKKAEEAAFKLALKQEEAELKAKAEAELVKEEVVETPVAEVIVDEKPTVASKSELAEMLSEEKAPTPAPTVAPSTDRRTALNPFIQVEIERNEILREMLNELKKLNEAKIILGSEYSARG